jgi:Predicted esterase of the alpha-beta hydrolase superfamily
MKREPKLGLALSGGGFRASLFHIGVLARLADCDLLRHVEVISTVSGGSIIGAYYYLKLKVLLESKADREITQEDYQDLVAEVLDGFMAAVQRNPRLLTFINPVKNLRFRRPDYSRCNRLGELLDELLYRPVIGRHRRTPVQMRELVIQPKGESPGFHPERQNHRRYAKVPVLLINATSLNTGRNWRFEAVRMGEPPADDPLSQDIDKRMRLPRPRRYSQLPPELQRIELGHAVAASAAVPGLFYPLAISGLYEGVRVELVDGGVHDNQGVRALLDRGCDQLIISDGSGQMDGQRHPGTAVLSVLTRANEILTTRVREEQLRYVASGKGPADHCLIHLRRDLEVEAVPYYDNAGRLVGGSKPSRQGPLEHGTAPEVQWALSRIRTDLDAFHDAEAYALMCNGYQIARAALPKAPGIWQRRGQVETRSWRFLQVAPLLERPTERFLELLKVGSSNIFKVWMLYRGLALGTAAIAIVTVSALAWVYRDALQRPIVPPERIPSASEVAGGVMVIALAIYASRWKLGPSLGRWSRLLEPIQRPLQWLYRLVVRGVLPALAALPLALYLKFLNPLYLKAGRVDRLLDGAGPSRVVIQERLSTASRSR